MDDVDSRVMEQLEAIQVRLGRVTLGISNRVGGEWGTWGGYPRGSGFYWQLRV